MSYKTETIKAYDKYPYDFENKFITRSRKAIIRKEMDDFLSRLKGKNILDFGSGSGAHTQYFQQKGFNVLCVDLLEEIVRLCEAKGLKAQLADIESLDLNRQFDGIWAHDSLLHITKSDIPSVVNILASHLKPGGNLEIAVMEGKKESFRINPKYPGTKRWFTKFTREEILELFDGKFTLLSDFQDAVPNKYTFLHFLFSKRA